MLLNDIARCDGVGSDADGWREGCEDCQRRVGPRSAARCLMMVPPPIIAFECEYRIPPTKGDHAA